MLGNPDCAIIAFTSSAYDIFSLIDRVHTSGGYAIFVSMLVFRQL
jgi:hypothetical protein